MISSPFFWWQHWGCCAQGQVNARWLGTSIWPQVQPRTPGWLNWIYFLTVLSKNKSAKVWLWFLLSKLNPGSSVFPLSLVCMPLQSLLGELTVKVLFLFLLCRDGVSLKVSLWESPVMNLLAMEPQKYLEPHVVDVPPIFPSSWGFYWGMLAVSSTGKLLEAGTDDNVCSQVSSKSRAEKVNHSFPSWAPWKVMERKSGRFPEQYTMVSAERNEGGEILQFIHIVWMSWVLSCCAAHLPCRGLIQHLMVIVVRFTIWRSLKHWL